MKKCSTKIIALVLTLVMVFTCNTTPAFAKSSGIKVTASKTTITVLDSANNSAKLKVTYGGKKSEY